ncbi:MAG: DUF1624 domain-containing protein [Caloramator sp.]|nr:DUF1624 domain-containing protein [Caloramator sp.]
MKKRIFEIDFLRFIAIILMIIYHFAYDIKYYWTQNINLEGLFLGIIVNTAQFLFIFVSGISSGFSRNSFKRGLRVFGVGILITIATYIFIRDEYVRFGILHFLGVCMMLYPLLSKLNNRILIAFAIISYYLGYIFKNITVDTFLFVPLGVCYKGFISIDYFPIFPYISYFILGILAYKSFYSKGRILIPVKGRFKIVEFISRNSLLIYIIHQPIFIGLIYLLRNLQK